MNHRQSSIKQAESSGQKSTNIKRICSGEGPDDDANAAGHVVEASTRMWLTDGVSFFSLPTLHGGV